MSNNTIVFVGYNGHKGAIIKTSDNGYELYLGHWDYDNDKVIPYAGSEYKSLADAREFAINWITD